MRHSGSGAGGRRSERQRIMTASSLSGLRGESDAICIESQIELCVGVEIQGFRPTFREGFSGVGPAHWKIRELSRSSSLRPLRIAPGLVQFVTLDPISNVVSHKFIQRYRVSQIFGGKVVNAPSFA